MGVAMRVDVVRAVRMVVGTVVSVAACHSVTVTPALRCADPCCGGDLASVDCSENRNVSCVEDADPCTARTFGCVDGSYYVGALANAPSSCSPEEGGEGGGLFLPGEDGGDGE
jgi:hypothetical protein